MEDEIKEIEKYKWIRSEQEHHDLGQDAVFEWISKYAAKFREYWELEHGALNGNCNTSGSWGLSGCTR